MKKDKGTLEVRDGSEALWYAGKKYALIIYITLCIHFFTQLIYDFKDGCGTFGFICVDLDKVPKETLEALCLIGAKIPDDMRYSTIMSVGTQYV